MGRGALPLPVPLVVTPGADVAESAGVPAADAIIKVSAGVGEGLVGMLWLRWGSRGRTRGSWGGGRLHRFRGERRESLAGTKRMRGAVVWVVVKTTTVGAGAVRRFVSRGGRR